MAIIRCEATDCLHHARTKLLCGVSESTQIDITNQGKCIDYSPLTDVEYKEIMGEDRPALT